MKVPLLTGFIWLQIYIVQWFWQKVIEIFVYLKIFCNSTFQQNFLEEVLNDILRP